jgi:polar amino acid transport system substrate-binding protein
VELTGVSTSKGVTAKSVSDKFKFQFSTTDNQEIIHHSEINALFVTTRHHLHASMVIEALKASKPVYVEKPLALSVEELNEIMDVYRSKPGMVMVGYNRRFAPVTAEVKKFYSRKISPLMIQYRINAGNIPKNHWIQDPVEGGGRIIGEVCHFIDLMIYILNAAPVTVFAQTISYNAQDITNRDNLIINIKFSDGSIGTIAYISIGDKSFPKEQIEIFGEQSVAVIYDFKKCILTRNGKTRSSGGSKQDKGYADSIQSFTNAVQKGLPAPIPFDELVMTSRTVFAILESLSKGLPITIQ